MIGSPTPTCVREKSSCVVAGRPKTAAPKEAVNIRLDPDVLAHFRGTGPGWQSRINAALRKIAGLT
jgi:uncharacterized protein (DUF4415 family)